MEIKIHVPDLVWLIGGSHMGGAYNKYYGSLGTDGMKGISGGKIFNYAVWIEKEDERELIKAAVYAGEKSLKNTSPEDVCLETFDAESNSIPIIKAWIEGKAKSFFAAEN